MMHKLKSYTTHQTVEQLNVSVQAHITHAKLKGNERKVLRCLASHALQYPGACQLKAITIAKECGISRSTVTRIIKLLKQKRIIQSQQTEKLNGILAANIYCINVANYDVPHITHVKNEPTNEPTNEPSEMSQRRDAQNVSTTTHTTEKRTDESVSFNQGYSKFEWNKDVRYVKDVSIQDALKQIYEPHANEHSDSFNELCKIAFGRLKQYMRLYSVPYEQMRHIVIRCMQQLVTKKDVRNEFAMYSTMIERQVKQLFEAPITPPMMKQNYTEIVPQWFEKRHDPPVRTKEEDEDLEAARQRVLKKLGVI